MAAYSDMHSPREGRSVDTGKLVNVAGAMVSLGLIVGVGVWGYKLVMRDVTGVPVVRAMEGAMRHAPSDPGGEISVNDGLSVNDVAALGGAAAPEEAESFVLAPQVSELTAEDLAVAPTAEAGEVLPMGVTETVDVAPEVAPAETVAVEPETPETAVAQALADASADDEAASLSAPMTAEEILAMADAIAAGIEPLTPTEEADSPDVITTINGVSTDVIADIIPSTVPGVSRSPRPILRPTDLNVAATVAPTAAVPTNEDGRSASQALAAASGIAAGSNLVQLGAFESAEVAQSEWQRFVSRFPDYMTGKTHIIQQAERGGRVFFRLRAVNFADLSDARRFCAALTAEGVDCVPVVVQ